MTTPRQIPERLQWVEDRRDNRNAWATLITFGVFGLLVVMAVALVLLLLANVLGG